VIKCFQIRLESFIYDYAFNGRDGCEDNGHKQIYMDEFATAKTMKLVANRADRFIRLNFVGRVTTLPLKGALPLCKAFGVNFYVYNPMGKDGVMGDHFVPAWLANAVDAEATMKAEPKQAQMKFAYLADSSAGPRSVYTEMQVELSLWQLTVKPGCYGKEDLTLTRPNMEAMMTEQSEVLKQIKKKRSEVRAAASGAGDAVLKEWRRVAKHLFK
jgi:hypothetical protein